MAVQHAHPVLPVLAHDVEPGGGQRRLAVRHGVVLVGLPHQPLLAAVVALGGQGAQQHRQQEGAHHGPDDVHDGEAHVGVLHGADSGRTVPFLPALPFLHHLAAQLHLRLVDAPVPVRAATAFLLPSVRGGGFVPELTTSSSCSSSSSSASSSSSGRRLGGGVRHDDVVLVGRREARRLRGGGGGRGGGWGQGRGPHNVEREGDVPGRVAGHALVARAVRQLDVGHVHHALVLLRVLLAGRGVVRLRGAVRADPVHGGRGVPASLARQPAHGPVEQGLHVAERRQGAAEVVRRQVDEALPPDQRRGGAGRQLSPREHGGVLVEELVQPPDLAVAVEGVPAQAEVAQGVEEVEPLLGEGLELVLVQPQGAQRPVERGHHLDGQLGHGAVVHVQPLGAHPFEGSGGQLDALVVVDEQVLEVESPEGVVRDEGDLVVADVQPDQVAEVGEGVQGDGLDPAAAHVQLLQLDQVGEVAAGEVRVQEGVLVEDELHGVVGDALGDGGQPLVGAVHVLAVRLAEAVAGAGEGGLHAAGQQQQQQRQHAVVLTAVVVVVVVAAAALLVVAVIIMVTAAAATTVVEAGKHGGPRPCKAAHQCEVSARRLIHLVQSHGTQKTTTITESHYELCPCNEAAEVGGLLYDSTSIHFRHQTRK